MKSFKEYIEEEWDIRTRINSPYHKFTYQKSLGNNQVDIDFLHYGDGIYNMGFTNNRTMQRRKKSEPKIEGGREVYHHVHSKIHQFIRAVRPKALLFSAADDSTKDMYHKLGRRIAKKYGAKFMPDDETGHMILFDRNKK